MTGYTNFRFRVCDNMVVSRFRVCDNMVVSVSIMRDMIMERRVTPCRYRKIGRADKDRRKHTYPSSYLSMYILSLYLSP
jgi:hypothetical protein